MKYLITILFFATAFSLKAQVKVVGDGSVEPTGNYPVSKMKHIYGKAISVQAIADRNAIPANMRDTGMLILVRTDSVIYTLVGGITNSDWQTFSLSGSGGGSSAIILDSVILSLDGYEPEVSFDLEQTGFKNLEVSAESQSAAGFAQAFNENVAVLRWQVAVKGDFKFYITYYY